MAERRIQRGDRLVRQHHLGFLHRSRGDDLLLLPPLSASARFQPFSVMPTLQIAHRLSFTSSGHQLRSARVPPP